MGRENGGLAAAKKNKNDEFYTLYADIQKEINAYLEYNPDTFRDKVVLLPCDDPEWSNFTRFFAQNFENFGLKKLISTSYATESKSVSSGQQFSIFDFITDFERNSPEYDEMITSARGKIFTLTRNENKKIDIDDLEWHYLNGDGDFRSEEVTKLRDEADIIITNPPFSLFREFLNWVVSSNKQFLMIGNINCLSYKEVLPLIRDNRIWLGNGMGRWISGFIVPEQYELYGTEARIEDGKRIIATNNCLWLTNLDHGRRHQPLQLMSMNDNIKFSKHKEIKGIGYSKYVNFDAIHIPFVDSIPGDYEGLMGVPITFLDKYNPEQFELIGSSAEFAGPITINGKEKTNPGRFYTRLENGELHREYDRLVIRKIVNK